MTAGDLTAAGESSEGTDAILRPYVYFIWSRGSRWWPLRNSRFSSRVGTVGADREKNGNERRPRAARHYPCLIRRFSARRTTTSPYFAIEKKVGPREIAETVACLGEFSAAERGCRANPLELSLWGWDFRGSEGKPSWKFRVRELSGLAWACGGIAAWMSKGVTVRIK